MAPEFLRKSLLLSMIIDLIEVIEYLSKISNGF